jgi:hypothetical protein
MKQEIDKEIKKGIIIFLSFILLSLILLIFLNFSFSKEDLTCVDGTKNNECSDIKPYFCSEGDFIKDATLCGCSSISKIEGNDCISKYETDSKSISLNYTLRGKEGTIDMLVYKGIYDYISNLPRSIDSSENPTILDFRLKNINEEFQKEFLFPLVIQIGKITKNKEDQARIAISLIQNIPFGYSNRSYLFNKINQVDYQRYAYEVLYDSQGVCGEKSGLLISLLRKLGYGTTFIYYLPENHEAVGIKCPIANSVNKTGYCFIETTGPSIIGDDKVEFISSDELTSIPQMLIVSEGKSFGDDRYEYKDAKILMKIRKDMKKYGSINFIQSMQFRALVKKYGLIRFDSYSF